MGKNIHITFRKKTNNWAATKAGNKRASAVADTKAEIEEIGRELAKAEQSELVIHNKDGVISDSDSFGNDPSDVKDIKH